MKLLLVCGCWLLTFAMVSIGGCSIIVGNYTWQRDYQSHWNLADKASTIPVKREKLSAFLAALKAGEQHGAFSSHDAVWLCTQDNQFSANLAMLETLVNRLEQIEDMDPASFEYNTAIQQITEQEQDDAHEMIRVLAGCYILHSYPLAWCWIARIYWIVVLVVIIFAVTITMVLAVDR